MGKSQQIAGVCTATACTIKFLYGKIKEACAIFRRECKKECETYIAEMNKKMGLSTFTTYTTRGSDQQQIKCRNFAQKERMSAQTWKFEKPAQQSIHSWLRTKFKARITRIFRGAKRLSKVGWYCCGEVAWARGWLRPCT